MNKFFLVLGTMAIMVACGGNQNPAENETESAYVDLKKLDPRALEQEIMTRTEAVANDTIGDKQLAVSLLEAYVAYSETYPEEPFAAEFTFKAGEIAMNLNHTAQAIELFTTVFDKYKDYEKRPYALFMKAFVAENQAEQYTAATKYYDQFIKLYPDHPMADDAKYSIENMGTSPEVLIRQFERRDSIEAAQKGV